MVGRVGAGDGSVVTLPVSSLPASTTPATNAITATTSGRGEQRRAASEAVTAPSVRGEVIATRALPVAHGKPYAGPGERGVVLGPGSPPSAPDRRSGHAGGLRSACPAASSCLLLQQLLQPLQRSVQPALHGPARAVSASAMSSTVQSRWKRRTAARTLVGEQRGQRRAIAGSATRSQSARSATIRRRVCGSLQRLAPGAVVPEVRRDPVRPPRRVAHLCHLGPALARGQGLVGDLGSEIDVTQGEQQRGAGTVAAW